MNHLTNFFNTTIQLNSYFIFIVAIIYIIIHRYRYGGLTRFLDIYLNYLPVLTHEFGHVLFNKLAGGRARDLVIVTSPSERQQTLQQGYAITQSKHALGQWFTTLGGYIMPPLMLLIGLVTAYYRVPSLFLLIYLFIFIYFLYLTSRKLSPIIVIILISGLLYLLLKHQQTLMLSSLISVSYHLILGVLLGEVIQSSWTIFKLTFQRPKPEWDGSALNEISHIPTLFYSLLWIGFNCYTVYLVLILTHII